MQALEFKVQDLEVRFLLKYFPSVVGPTGRVGILLLLERAAY